jgi:hypothetical protein
MNIDKVFHHNKELTVQCAQTGERNVWVRVCWLAGQCEGTFSVENQLLSRAKGSASIKKIYLQMKAKPEQRKFYATINNKTITP